MRRASIPMTSAVGMGPLPDLLEASSGKHAVRRVFDEQGLPLELTASPQVRMPLASMIALFESAGVASGERNFGLRVGQRMQPHEYGVWAAYSASAPTLHVALERFIRGLKLFQPHARSLLQFKDGCVEWSYRRPGLRVHGMHHADHILPPMIRLVQGFLGGQWLPQRAHVCYPKDAAAHQFESALGVPVRFGTPFVGLTLDRADLLAPRRQRIVPGEQLTFADVCAAASEQPETPLAAIRAILQLRLMKGEFDLDRTASMAGIGPRSLQRMLRASNTSYRALVEQVRIQRAVGLLEETDQPIAAIALSLGYREPGNFTRAFRRARGCSPLQCRKGAGRQSRPGPANGC